MPFSSFVLRNLTSEAESVGIGSPTLLAGILEPSTLVGGHFWVRDRDMCEIVGRALSVSDTPGLGLRLGARGSFAGLGASGMLLTVAESFRQALRAFAHFEGVARDQKSMCLKEAGSTLTLEFAPLEGPIQFQECMTEFIARSLAVLLARFAGPPARLARVNFNYPAPAHVAAYEAAFGCELHFDAPRLAIAVDAALADRVQLLSQPALAEHLWQLSEEELIRVPRQRTVIDEVRDGLRVDGGARPPLIGDLARRLGLSERSLRRRLAELNVDYRSLVAERQREVARQMLRRQGVTIKEVAYELGYVSPSAFHRAFKRWTGASPKEHRRLDA